MVLDSYLLCERSQNQVKHCEDMDVPKITVFKSPPWTKPEIKPQIIPKISDVYEEFPKENKLFNAKKNSYVSRSLECIPENTILRETHTYSTAHLRDQTSSRLSPHSIIPPISPTFSPPLLREDLPEMRQRAYSDPHRYRRKSDEQKKESPLAKNSTPYSPPKELFKVERSNLSPDHKLHVNRNHSSPVISSGPLKAKPPTHNSGKAEIRVRKTSQTSHNKKDTKMSQPQVRPRKFSLPATSQSTNLSKTRELKNPAVRALMKDDDEFRYRTNSMPARPSDIITEQTSTSEKKNGISNTAAYALCGSPGRNRWPSPDRDATSYIVNSESTSDEGSRKNSEERLDITPIAIPSGASREFKSIIDDFKPKHTTS